MSRALLILDGPQNRAKAANWVMKAPPLTRVEFKAAKRSLPQNAKLWAMLTEVAEQAEWAGKKRTADQWKDLFTGAFRADADGLEIVPGLNGGFMLLGLRTSDLSVAEMADLITFIEVWGLEHGVVFSTGDEVRAA